MQQKNVNNKPIGSNENYSVLMSVYSKENPDFLRLSMDSMFNQTVKTNDFVLMCDGPLTKELNAVISEFENKYKEILHVIRFEKNQGLGHALQQGVLACRNELIARMDSDDISRPDRCEMQLNIFAQHPEVSIVGGIIEEFSETPDSVNGMRVVPESSEEIIRFAKSRNPFNHPSVMYKKSAVLKAGNYSDVRYMQDYYLWVDMLICGIKGYNIQKPLVWMRADSELFKRRSGKLYAQIQINLFKKMKDAKFITQTQFLKFVTIRVLSATAPNWLRKFMFKKVLRKDKV